MSIVWYKLLEWCKKRWELLVGFFLGIFALLAIFKGGSSKKLLKKKNESSDKILEAEKTAREKMQKEYEKNIDTFLENNKDIEEEAKQKLISLEGEKRERVNELLSSDNPNAAISDALSNLLK